MRLSIMLIIVIVILLIDFESALTQIDSSRNKDNYWIYVREAIGELDIINESDSDTISIYFDIPISFEGQIPIFFEVECPGLINHRFLDINPPNTIMTAQVVCPDSALLRWTAWVIIEGEFYSDLPDFAPIPDTSELSDEIKKWLLPSDIIQSNDSLIIEKALEIKDTNTNIISIAQNIASFMRDSVPWTFDHTPIGFDAYYTLHWGNSCTGHAHLAAALFRALGIPARSISCIPPTNSVMDMHWIIDYYIPDYGWVKMESSTGINPYLPTGAVVTLVSNPEDEFPVFYLGLEGYFHNSSPDVSMMIPDWESAHHALSHGSALVSESQLETAMLLADSVFEYYKSFQGINMNDYQDSLFEKAINFQKNAIYSMIPVPSANTDSFNICLSNALECYNLLNVGDRITLYMDNFEDGVGLWSHGGIQDEWEHGIPSFENTQAHSGLNCWGTDLHDTYENNADNWLLSPEVDLENLAEVKLSFWIRNKVEDAWQGYAYDPFWVELVINGERTLPLCSHMVGVSDDAAIPKIGGWSKVVLDLNPYIGQKIQIKFRFSSNNSIVYSGTYIDDVSIYGRAIGGTGINIYNPESLNLSVFPNPASSIIHIEHPIFTDCANIFIYDISGRKIEEARIPKNQRMSQIDISSFSEGVYILIIKQDNKSCGYGKFVVKR